MVPIGRVSPQPPDKRVVGCRAGIRHLDIRVFQMGLGDLDHQKRAGREGRQRLVEGRLPRVGDARLDEHDEARDHAAVETQGVDAAHVEFRQPVDRFAREGRPETIYGHGGTLAPLPPGSFQRKEGLRGGADVLGCTCHLVAEFALFLQSPQEPAELAPTVRVQCRTHVAFPVELADHVRPFIFVGHGERQVVRGRNEAEDAREGAIEPDLGKHEHARQLQMRPRQHRQEILQD